MARPDAVLHHTPDAAPGLIEQAVVAVGTKAELARRLGITTEQLRLLSNGTHQLKYSLQYTIEKIIEANR